MKKFRWLVLFLAVLVTYAGFQGFRYFSRQYETETVMQFTMTDQIKAEGIAVRSEEVISGSLSGVQRYLYSDGVKVLKNSAVAQSFSSQSDIAALNKIQQLEEEITNLEEAQSTAKGSTAHAQEFSEQVVMTLGEISDNTYQNKISEVTSQKSELLALLCKRQAALGKENDFSGRISTLTSQKENLERSVAEPVDAVLAPATGYFSKTVDGLETLTPEMLEEMSADQIKGLLYTEQNSPSGMVGKIVTDPNWYFVAVVSAEDLKKIEKEREVSLDFRLSNTRAIPATVEKIVEGEKGKDGVVIFRCNIVSEDCISLRSQTVQIQFKIYSGLRVSQEAVRYVDGVKGVYIKTQSAIVFKPIDPVPLYENSTFILCSEGYGGENSLKLYDEIIVEGTDLYDGKPVK